MHAIGIGMTQQRQTTASSLSFDSQILGIFSFIFAVCFLIVPITFFFSSVKTPFVSNRASVESSQCIFLKYPVPTVLFF